MGTLFTDIEPEANDSTQPNHVPNNKLIDEDILDLTVGIETTTA